MTVEQETLPYRGDGNATIIGSYADAAVTGVTGIKFPRIF